MTGEAGYKKLIAWKKADELAYKVYLATSNFPKEETFGIVSQLRRAALSVPTNLAEGAGRRGKAELKRFTSIALGSLAEVSYLLDFSLRLKYLYQANYESLRELCQETGRILWGFHNSL
jgi:four helix bundle protein